MAERELDISDGRAILPGLMDAIDLASDQGQATWLTSGGKRVAKIVTTEEGELLDAIDGLCICGPDAPGLAPGWRHDCPNHGTERARGDFR